MTLVKVDQDIVQVIGREQDHFTVLTREREVKRVSASQINTVNKIDIETNLRNLRKEKVVCIQDYRKLKKYIL